MAPLNPARMWALATAGLLTQRNEHAHDLLGGALPSPESVSSRLALLERDWNAGSRAGLLAALAGLAGAGDRKAYNDAASLNPNAAHDPVRSAQVAFVHKHRARIGAKSLLAWDAGRLVTIAGWGALAQLISEDEAWSFILPMAIAVQRTYRSWDELGKHYLLGREFATGSWDPPLARAHLALLDDAASPWRTLPWDLDLGQHGLTAPLQPIALDVQPIALATPPLPLPGAPQMGAPQPGAVPMALARDSAPSPKAKRNAVPIVIGGAALLVVAGGAAAFGLGLVKTGAAPAPSVSASASPSEPPSASSSAPKGSSVVPSAAPQPSAAPVPSHAPSRSPAPPRAPPHGRGSPKKH